MGRIFAIFATATLLAVVVVALISDNNTKPQYSSDQDDDDNNSVDLKIVSDSASLALAINSKVVNSEEDAMVVEDKSKEITDDPADIKTVLKKAATLKNDKKIKIPSELSKFLAETAKLSWRREQEDEEITADKFLIKKDRLKAPPVGATTDDSQLVYADRAASSEWKAPQP